MGRISWISWGLVALVAVLHVAFMGMEMFAAEKVGRDVAKLPEAVINQIKPIVWNQGLYNGFLAAGLLWSLRGPRPSVDLRLAVFFVTCALIRPI